MDNFVHIQDENHFKEMINKTDLVVIDFWAEWCGPCTHMNDVFSQLAKSYPSILFLCVDAEQVDEVPDYYDIDAVPAFVFLNNGNPVDKLVGANAVDLANKMEQFGKTKQNEDYNQIQEGLPTQPEVDLNERLTQLTNYAPIMVFIKGTPDEPQCGFSRKIIETLKRNKVTFSSFNILSDDSIRQGLKTFSDWKTYPQLYVNGKLIGGLDIVKELEEDNELLETLQPGLDILQQNEQNKEELLNKRLKQLIATAPVMVFMKGTPDAPKCGFSSQLVGILNDNGVKYSSFNILADQEVRQGIKKFSDWPTFPQLYVNEKLIGGLDIVKELVEDNELVDVIPSHCIY